MGIFDDLLRDVKVEIVEGPTLESDSLSASKAARDLLSALGEDVFTGVSGHHLGHKSDPQSAVTNTPDDRPRQPAWGLRMGDETKKISQPPESPAMHARNTIGGFLVSNSNQYFGVSPASMEEALSDGIVAGILERFSKELVLRLAGVYKDRRNWQAYNAFLDDFGLWGNTGIYGERQT